MTGRWLRLIPDIGGKPKLVSVSDVTSGRSPPPVGCMLHGVNALKLDHLVRRTTLWGTQWGQLDSREALS